MASKETLTKIIPQAKVENPAGNNGSDSGNNGSNNSKSRERVPLHELDPHDLIGLYFNEAGRQELLSKEQEQQLAAKIAAGKKAQKQLAVPGLDSEVRRSLEQAVAIGEEAFNHFYQANLKLVVSIAKGFRGRGVPYLDIIQEGNIALLKAVEGFNPDKNNRFVTYAARVLWTNMAKAVYRQRRNVRLPAALSREIGQLNKAEKRLTKKLNCTPSEQELAETTGSSIDRVVSLILWGLTETSLNKPVKGNGADDTAELGELVPDDNGVEETVVKNELRKRIERLLRSEQITPRQKGILIRRYGFDGAEKLTYREIGEIFGITGEWARQLNKRALAKLEAEAEDMELRLMLSQV